MLAFIAVLISFLYIKFSLDTAETTRELVDGTKETVEKTQQRTETTTREVHGNSNDNCDLHKVYEIYSVDSWGIRRTLKYGITSQCDFKRKDGNPRPEYQVRYFQILPEYKYLKIKYDILDSLIEGRIEAKNREKHYVNQYFIKHNKLPERQKRPLPEDFMLY